MHLQINIKFQTKQNKSIPPHFNNNVNTFCNAFLPTFAIKSHILSNSKHHFDRKMSSTRYRFTFIASTLSEQFGHSRGHRIYNKNKTIQSVFPTQKISFWLEIVITVKCHNGSFLDSRSTVSGIVNTKKL